MISAISSLGLSNALSASDSALLDKGVARTRQKHSDISAEQMARIDKTAKDFEAMFITQMIKPMFDTVQVNPMFGGGNAENVARSFLLQEYGKVAADSSSIGIAPMIKEAMLRLQEENNNLLKGENYDRTA